MNTAGDQSARQGCICKEDTDLKRTLKAGWDRAVPSMDPTLQRCSGSTLHPTDVFPYSSPHPNSPKRCPTCNTRMLYTFSQQKTAFCPIFSVSGRADPIGPLTTSMKTRDVSISSHRFNTDEATKKLLQSLSLQAYTALSCKILMVCTLFIFVKQISKKMEG